MANEPTNTGIDKDAHYGRHQRHQDKVNDLDLAQKKARSELALQIAHKALDEPQKVALDDMNIDARKTTTNTGLGTLGVLGVAAMAGLPPAALALWLALRPASTLIPPAPTIATPAKSWVAVYETQGPDGKWTETKREPLITKDKAQ